MSLSFSSGDFKAANIFFENGVDFSSVEPKMAERADLGKGVAFIDWQWTGSGLGAMDLIYMFATSLQKPELAR